VHLIDRTDGNSSDAEEMTKAYADWDISVVTAARLSATFSYVSPICRPIHEGVSYAKVPFADGGYAENEGILTVLQAINQLLSYYDAAHAPPFERILVVRILPFEIAAASLRSSFEEINPVLEHQVAEGAWRRALTGPLELLAQVRTSSQTERGEWEAVQLQASSLTTALLSDALTRAEENETPQISRAQKQKSAVDLFHRYRLARDLARQQRTATIVAEAAPGNHRGPAPIQVASVKFVFSLPSAPTVTSAGTRPREAAGEWDDYVTPLSWKLNEYQQRAIDAAWKQAEENTPASGAAFRQQVFIADFAEEDGPTWLTLDDVFGVRAGTP
jgi:hypothetical protein